MNKGSLSTPFERLLYTHATQKVGILSIMTGTKVMTEFSPFSASLVYLAISHTYKAAAPLPSLLQTPTQGWESKTSALELEPYKPFPFFVLPEVLVLRECQCIFELNNSAQACCNIKVVHIQMSVEKCSSGPALLQTVLWNCTKFTV